MKPIRYANFGSTYSPFSNPGLSTRLAALGFERSSLFGADLIITRCLKNAQRASVLFPFKKIIVWTHEPRFDSTPDRIAKGMYLKTINVFNVYTGNVFLHNSHFFGSYHYDDSMDLGITSVRLPPAESVIDRASFKQRKCLLGAFSKKPPASFHFSVGNSANLDANLIRQSLIEDAVESGMGDIVGKGWGGMEIEDSGFDGSNEKPWWIRKVELLADYNFSIAIENTIYPHYVTEKIWQSIKALSLPVYVGKGSSIYETFPRNSFLDFSEFASNHELLEYIKNMNYDSWCKRMDACISTYNKETERLESRNDTLTEVVQQIQEQLFKAV